MKKRILALLLASVLCLSLFPVALASDTKGITNAGTILDPDDNSNKLSPTLPSNPGGIFTITAETYDLWQTADGTIYCDTYTTEPTDTTKKLVATDGVYSLSGSGVTYTLKSDIKIAYSLLVTGKAAASSSPVILSLNGHVLQYTGDSGSVIRVEQSGALKVQDGTSYQLNSPEHKFRIDDSGLWVLDETNGTKTINGGIITGGKATVVGSTYSGGGVYIKNGTFTLDGGYIIGNTAGDGGGVYIEKGTFTMNSGTIAGNTAVGNSTFGGKGGGVFNRESTFTMNAGSIRDNATSGKYNAGGAVCNTVLGSVFTMSGGYIVGNNAYMGGGVYNADNASFGMTDGAISGNSADFGGGVYNGSIFTMSGSSITGNNCVQIGGGVCHEGESFTVGGNVKIKDNVKGGTKTLEHYTGETANNVYLTIDNATGKSKIITVGQGGFDTGAYIGVTTQETADRYPNTITISSPISVAPPFYSDLEEYDSMLVNSESGADRVWFAALQRKCDHILGEDGKCKTCEQLLVASLTASTGTAAVTTYYKDLKAATEAAKKRGGTIKLLQDTGTDFVWGDTFTLDLNGKTMNCTLIVSGGTFILKDTGTGGSISKIECRAGTPILTGGTVKELLTTGGVTTISGGTFSGTATIYSDVNISGGTFNSAVTVKKGSTGISGGTFHQSITIEAGTIAISKDMSAEPVFKEAVEIKTGALDISGGTFEKNVTVASGTDTQFSGGTFQAGISYSGNYGDLLESYCYFRNIATGAFIPSSGMTASTPCTVSSCTHEPISDSDLTCKNCGQQLAVKVNAATACKYYPCFAEAWHMTIGDGYTYTLLADTDLSGLEPEHLKGAYGDNDTMYMLLWNLKGALDLNGHTLRKCTRAADGNILCGIAVSGSGSVLTIQDSSADNSGKIEAAAPKPSVMVLGGTLNILSGTFDGTAAANGGTMKITDGIFKDGFYTGYYATQTEIVGGTFEKASEIAGKTEISGGTFGELQIVCNGVTQLSGGTFAKIESNVATDADSVGALLADGYSFRDANGDLYDNTSTAHELTNVSVVETPTSTSAPAASMRPAVSGKHSGAVTVAGNGNEVMDYSKTFGDVSENDYFSDAVRWASARSITGGTSATTFGPHESCIRGQFVTFLWRVSGMPKAMNESGMKDVSADAYWKDAISWAVEKGIVNGYGDKLFGVDDTITREQAATILFRFAQFMGTDTTQGGMAVREYNDYESISGYAIAAMQWAVNTGILQGDENNNLMPGAPCSRAQIVTMLYRLLGR